MNGSQTRPGSMQFPVDLAAWQRWQGRHRPVLQRIRATSTAPAPTAVLTLGSPDADLLVACDQDTPSLRSAVADPVRSVDRTRLAVVAPVPRRDLCGRDAVTRPVSSGAEVAAELAGLRASLTVGDHLPWSRMAHEATELAGGRTFVIQHGLLTRYSPPLPRDVTLVAWSQADAEFWRAGRADVDVVVAGSQLLWTAAAQPATPVDPEAPPTFLGQMHAAELSRASLFRASAGFCRAHRATYRPHPSEVDKASRLAHAVMRTGRIAFDTSAAPLVELGTPVVAVFSSGLVEASTAGIPAWGYLPAAPKWVGEFWERYGISRWGADPTPAPPRPGIEPAVRIAELAGVSTPVAS